MIPKQTQINYRMADLKNTLTQVGEVVIDLTVKDNFDRMMIALKKDINSTLDLESSYMSKYDIIDELRTRVNKEVVLALSGSAPVTAALLDPANPLAEIAKVEANYNTLEEYINGLPTASFDPPLGPLIETSGSAVMIVPTLPYPAVDPRRTGNIVSPKLGTITGGVQTWLLNNSILYGFVLYGTHSLYYLGKDNIKNQLKTDSSKLKAIVGRFLAKGNALIDGLITTAATVIANTYPPPPPPPVPTPVAITPGDILLKYHARNGFRQIVLHHTVGGGTAARTVEGLYNRANKGKGQQPNATSAEIAVGEHKIGGFVSDDAGNKYSIANGGWWSGIHIAADAMGAIARGDNNNLNLNIPASSNLNTWGVGIEIGTFGALRPRDPANLANTVWNTAYGTPSFTAKFANQPSNNRPDKKVVNLGFSYNGENYWDDFSDAQIVSLRGVINQILTTGTDGPKLKSAIQGKNVYSDVFGINPNPQLGGVYVGSKLTSFNDYGIFTHNRGSGPGGHDDTFPSPKIVNMLKTFGMVGNPPQALYYTPKFI